MLTRSLAKNVDTCDALKRSVVVWLQERLPGERERLLGWLVGNFALRRAENLRSLRDCRLF